MGFWDLLSSTNQTLKYGYAAVNKVANVVRVVGAQKVEEYLSDPQAREKIGPIESEKMGFWDLLSSTNQTLKYGYAAVNKVANVVRVVGAQKVEEYLSDPQAREKIGPIESEKMGFWDLLSSTNQTLKYGYAAVNKVANVVRVDGAHKVEEYLSDPQAREKIGRIATNVAGVVVPEILKSVPGGVQIYRIARDGLMDRPPYNHGSEKSNSKEMMEEMQKKMDKIQEEISNINYHNRILLERIKQYESPNER